PPANLRPPVRSTRPGIPFRLRRKIPPDAWRELVRVLESELEQSRESVSHCQCWAGVRWKSWLTRCASSLEARDARNRKSRSSVTWMLEFLQRSSERRAVRSERTKASLVCNSLLRKQLAGRSQGEHSGFSRSSWLAAHSSMRLSAISYLNTAPLMWDFE